MAAGGHQIVEAWTASLELDRSPIVRESMVVWSPGYFVENELSTEHQSIRKKIKHQHNTVIWEARKPLFRNIRIRNNYNFLTFQKTLK